MTGFPKFLDGARKDLLIIYLFASACAVYLVLLSGVCYTPDLNSYVVAWNHSYSSWHIDRFRTPVYPIFIGLVQEVVGPHYLWVVIGIQYLIFFVSIPFFHRLLTEVTASKSISFWLTLFYSSFPGMAILNNYVQTESITISLSVFMAWAFLSLINGKSRWPVLPFVVFLALLVFSRPAQLYFMPVLVAVFIAMCLFKRVRRAGIRGLSGTLFVCLLFALWVNAFHKNYGVTTPSGISVVNQYHIGRTFGLINKDNLENQKMAPYLVQEKGPDFLGFDIPLYDETFQLIDDFGLKSVNDEVKASIKRDPGGWTWALWRRFRRSGYDRLFSFGPFNSIREMMGVRMSSVYVFAMVILAFLCFSIHKTKHVPWFSVTLFLLVAGNLATSVLGAQTEWGRLALPSTPFMFILLGEMLAKLTFEEEFQNDSI